MAERIEVLVPPLPNPLTYEVPDNMAHRPGPGYIVEVPLGKRTATGFVLKNCPATDKTEFSLKPVKHCPLPYASFTKEQLRFFEWVADYHGDQLANVIDVALPAYLTPKIERFVEYRSGLEEIPPRNKKQLEIAQFLRDQKEPVPFSLLNKRFKNCGAVLKKMHARDWIHLREQELKSHHIPASPPPAWAKGSVVLNEEQLLAKEKIETSLINHEFKPFVLHGVTGSGKTEVYLELISKALEMGKSALIVVPEIALTPQLVDRFRARLQQEIAVLHSGLPRRARWDAWRALLEGKAKIALGARSAIFAPLQNPGIIIVDEEHDSSFKQSEGLRYNGRDLALVRAKLESCPVILGSATPSLESFSNAKSDRYEYLELAGRHQSGSDISIEIVDLNRLRPWEMKSRNISPALYSSIESALQKKEQTFILYNKRGFSSYLQCERCENVVECPNCSVTFTFHQHSNQLVCHYCNLHTLRPKYCSSCSENQGNDSEPASFVDRGAGTEKIFDELKELFAEANILRLDRDSVTSIKEYTDILDQVRDGSCDILVGTQMIAKGHDLPEVTLVGVVDCDVGLHMPDFRAGERVYQLLTQVSGRAGRGSKAGKVLLQTRVPNNASLQFTLNKDYEGFAEQELAQRKQLGYPPYKRILRILCKAPQMETSLEVLAQYKEYCKGLCNHLSIDTKILGPAPAPIERIRAEWRAHLIVKADRASELSRLTRELRNIDVSSRKVKVLFDLDPQDML